MSLLYPIAQATEISLHRFLIRIWHSPDDAFAGKISGNWTLCFAGVCPVEPVLGTNTPSPSNIRPSRDVDQLLTGRFLLPLPALWVFKPLLFSLSSLLHSLYHSGGATCFRLCTLPSLGCQSGCYMFAPLYAWTCHIPLCSSSLTQGMIHCTTEPLAPSP